MNSQGVITIKSWLILAKEVFKCQILMLSLCSNFILLFVYTCIYNLWTIAPIDRRCAGGRNVLNFLNFSPLPVIGWLLWTTVCNQHQHQVMYTHVYFVLVCNHKKNKNLNSSIKFILNNTATCSAVTGNQFKWNCWNSSVKIVSNS